MSSPSPSIFTPTSALSLAGVGAIGLIAYIGTKILLPKDTKWQDRYTFIWLAFDALIHFTFEGPWLYLSTFGRQVNTSEGVFAELWKEYSRADSRWGISDPTTVSLELLTVLGVGPMACYVLKQIVTDDPARHYWIIVLSTAELYGGFMTFCPEWLIGSPSLDTSNALYFWVYLFFMNIIWVIIPLWLMVDSYGHIAGSLRAVKASKAKSKRN
jgi:hypothetical protein